MLALAATCYFSWPMWQAETNSVATHVFATIGIFMPADILLDFLWPKRGRPDAQLDDAADEASPRS